MKIISQLLIILFSGLLFGQDAEKTDLEILPNYLKINKEKYKNWLDF